MTKGAALHDKGEHSGQQDEDHSFLSSIQDVYCHPECNEGSRSSANEILRCTQDDNRSDSNDN